MKKVILVRHGKSSWADPNLEDHDRPLAPRGIAAAPVIAAWLEARGHRPDAVLCSSSRRTRQTHARMAEAMSLPDPLIEPELYHASPAGLRARLRSLDPKIGTVMVIGHQPGLGGLARKLARAPVRSRCARAFEHFPTAAAAVLTLEEPWPHLEFGAATFVDFAKPRELAEQD